MKKPIMGASKTTNYSSEIKEMSIISRALAHPSRMFIYEELKKKKTYRNIDFSIKLGVSETTIHHHLKKMKSAQLIDFEFHKNAYTINLIHDPISKLIQFLNA